MISLKNADALVIGVDLHSLAGAEFARQLGLMHPVVSSCLPTARLLRCRYLVISNHMAKDEMLCTPCCDKEALREAVNHAYLLLSKGSTEIGVLVMPDSMAPDVFAQVAITLARHPKQPKKSKTGK